MKKVILDACCGSRTLWFDKEHPLAVYMDNRICPDTLCNNMILTVSPDVLADFRNMPFKRKTFNLVIFDPPHLLNIGDASWMAKKYGRLDRDNWRDDIKKGFNECMRVLKKHGGLIFKWSERDIKTRDVIKAIGQTPLIGEKRSNCTWLIFIKE